MSTSASDIQRLIDIANEVAYTHCLSPRWSTWHFWNRHHRADHSRPAANDDATANGHISNVATYGSCVDIAFRTTAALREGLAREPELWSHARKVYTLARAKSANPDELIHCITALLEDDFCIVIDFSCDFQAIRIALGEQVDSLPHINMAGVMTQDRLKYVVGDGEEQHGQRVVVWVPPPQYNESPTQFKKYDNDKLTQKINIRMAEEREDAPERGVPKSKRVKLQSEYLSQPACIPSVYFNGRYLATLCRIKVDFTARQLTMQVPHHDWLCRPENAGLYEKVAASPVFQPIDITRTLSEGISRLPRGLDSTSPPAVANLVLELVAPRGLSPVKENVEVLCEVGRRVGLDEEELIKMIDSVYEVWADGDGSGCAEC